jgi:hypothetical protein
MASFPTTEAEDRVEEWLDVPMFFASVGLAAYERALRESGFQIERSEFREEIDPRYGAGGHQWIVARKPGVESGDRR